tara:strand:+ start:120 stop:497 length:378 start_codon:yes stop_codon:yes gene_type:complete
VIEMAFPGTRYLVKIGTDYYIENPDSGVLETISGALAEEIIGTGATVLEMGENFLTGAASRLGSFSLDFVEGFGSAVVNGVEFTYDTVREKLRGREDNVIAGFTVGFMAVLTLVLLYNSAKKGGA